MFNDTVQFGQVGVNLSEELMLPEAVVSEVELSPFSGLKTWRWRLHVSPKREAHTWPDFTVSDRKIET